ncbi:hypothetical protein ACEQ8H_002326 [Pleosporales sp. CAS-2024a]
MSAPRAHNHARAPQRAGSPLGTCKPSLQSPDAHSWSGAGSSGDDGDGDGDGGRSAKRKRPLSVSCETCKTRKPRKKPGLRAGYGRELEARLDKLETLLAQQQTQIQHLSHTHTHTHSPQDLAAFRPSPPILHHTAHGPRPETALFLQKAASTFPSHNALHTQSQFGPGPTDSFSSYSEQYSPSAARATGLGDAHFPPHDLLYALVDLFFKHVYPWCPILHRQTTLNALFGDTALDDEDKIILHAVVATTVKFSSDARLTAEKRARYRASSKSKVLLYGLENSSVKSLQALVILALDVVGCSNGPPGWNLLALITRSVVQLGLAMEMYSPAVAPQYASIYTLRAIVLPEPKDWIEEESRRRLFWMIYVLDRYATAATAFEFALDENEIDRRLPCRDDLYARNVPVETRWFHTCTRSDYSMNRPENLGTFSYFVEVLGLLTKVHKFLKKPVDITSLQDVETWQKEYRALDHAIEEWKYNLPPELGNSARVFANPGIGQRLATVNSGLVMLHAAFHTTIIRLHSSAAYPTHRSPIFAPSFAASQKCLSAVENIKTLCSSARNNGLISKLGPPFAFSLWVAARVLLVHGSTIDHRVDSSINLLVDTLREFGQFWEVGTRYADLLSRVLFEYQESQQTPTGLNGERVTPSTVKILADMRRCAFDLDFLISRQPKLNSAAGLPVITPARTPAQNELEYLDVFDFFNMPRLPVSLDGAMSYATAEGINIPEVMFGNESNITNYMVDASSDWFMKQSS